MTLRIVSAGNFELFKEFSGLVEERLGELLAERTPVFPQLKHTYVQQMDS